MWNKLKLAAIVTAVGAIALGSALRDKQPAAAVHVQVPTTTLDQLELSDDGILIDLTNNQPFNGQLIESYNDGQRKSVVTIVNGLAHGDSKGWHENGQLEVRETFLHGVSNGVRTRWHANGKKRSQAEIIDGKICGEFLQWHANGERAAVVTMLDGLAHGPSHSWHPDGSPKARVEMHQGTVAEQTFFR